MEETKICKRCDKYKLKSLFNKKYKLYCNDCQKIRDAEYRLSHKELIKNNSKKYYNNNKEIIKEKQIIYLDKEDIKINRRKNKINKYNSDPIFKCRDRISTSIRRSLKNSNKYKEVSSWSKLPYTQQQLKEYIETQFKLPGNEWMNWDNWKPYNPKTWDDKNAGTYTWNLDHIIPQSLLPYDSFDHPNFLKAWALDNLRPYSAKQNIIDGNRRFVEKIQNA